MWDYCLYIPVPVPVPVLFLSHCGGPGLGLGGSKISQPCAFGFLLCFFLFYHTHMLECASVRYVLGEGREETTNLLHG